MLRIDCPVCNGLLELGDGQREAVCKNCGKVVTVPQGYTELESGYLFAAEAVQRRDFAGAAQAYGDIVKAHPDRADAWFRRAMAVYEVEYEKLEDGTYRLICHQAEKGDFLQYADVKKALSLAEDPQKEKYQAEAQRIHRLQEQVIAYAKSHPPVDVWLEVSGDSLVSLNRAVQIRQLLESMNLSVFCQALEPELPQGEAQEIALYRAYSTAKLMVLAASEPSAFTDEVNFNAERFLYRKEKAVRAAKGQIPSLVTAFENLDEYEDIPDSYFDGIDRRLNMALPSFAADLRTAVEDALADYRGALKEQAGTHGSFTYANLLLKARQTLEKRDFKAAAGEYEEILLKNPTESQAYWGLLLCERECPSEEALIESGREITEEGNYRSALAFASEREQQTYRDVAERVREMASVYAEQEKERQRLEAEQEEERRRKEEEVLKAEEQKRQMEEWRKRKRAMRIRAFLIAVPVIAVAGLIAYISYTKSPAGVAAKQYKEATTAFNHSQWQEAYDLYRDLEDYKDSAQMAEQCKAIMKQITYSNAVAALDDMRLRADAVSDIRGTTAYVAEAQGKLEDLEEEGVQYLEEGRLYEAWETLRNMYSSDERGDKEAFLKAWRQAFNRGYLCGAPNKLLAVNEDGDLLSYGMDESFGLEEGKVLSVSLSDSGASGGVVRRDGTAYLLGRARDFGGVDGWSNLVSIHVSDQIAAGLTADGGLYVTGRGQVASDVSVFDVCGGDVIAVRSDGSIYCTDASVEIPGDWSDIAYAILVPPAKSREELSKLPELMWTDEEKILAAKWRRGETGNGVLAVTSDGRLLESGVESGLGDTGVLAVYRGCGKIATVSIDADYFYFAAIAATDEETVYVKSERGAHLTGEIYGTTDSDIGMRNAMKDMEDVGMPYPYETEEE